jgi:hypothetical protein
MRAADYALLLKKIVVGVVVAAIPLLIILGGLWVTRVVLEHPRTATVHGAKSYEK